MRLHVGDPVQVRRAPEIDPSIWQAAGIVLGLGPDDHVIVELEDGQDCTLHADQLFLRGELSTPEANPFDVFPGPRERGDL